MIHHSDELLVRAERCTYQSYLLLAKSLPAHADLSRPGLTIARSHTHFAYSNFIGIVDKSLAKPSLMREVAEEHFQFIQPNVFLILSDSETGLLSDFQGEGFSEAYRLAVMVKFAEGGQRAPLPTAVSKGERRHVARFMAESFLQSLPFGARQTVIAATADSALELVALPDVSAKHLDSAAMFAVLEEEIGLFNVCVDRRKRGLGLGAELMRRIEHLPDADGKAICLQCHQETIGFYKSLGYAQAGTLYCFRQAGVP